MQTGLGGFIMAFRAAWGSPGLRGLIDSALISQST